MDVAHLEVAATVAQRDVFADQDAQPRAVDVGHLVEVENDIDAAREGELVDRVDERVVAVAKHEPALDVEYRHVAGGPHCELHGITSLGFRVFPVFTDADVDSERHLQLRGRLHFFLNDPRELVGARLRHLEQQLVMDRENHARVGV